MNAKNLISYYLISLRSLPDVPGLVVAPLRGGIDGGVRDAAAGDAEWLHHLALRLLHALDGLRVDGDVAGLAARESHLRSLLVAVRHLNKRNSICNPYHIKDCGLLT